MVKTIRPVTMFAVLGLAFFLVSEPTSACVSAKPTATHAAQTASRIAS